MQNQLTFWNLWQGQKFLRWKKGLPFLLSALHAMKAGLSEKRSVTPKKAIEIFERYGYQINEKEAEEILDFLYFYCKLTVDQLVKENKNTKSTSNENSRFIHTGKH